MQKNTLVLYHADCLDGFGAAYAAWRHFGDNADYEPMHYGRPYAASFIEGRDVYILDASFPREVLQDMASHAKSVFLLDHHASARDQWQSDLQQNPDNGLWLYRDPERPLTVAFDMDKSGTRLAWEHFQPNQALPRALAHIEDQDLWRFKIVGTKAFCRALRVRPFDFIQWDGPVLASDALPTSAEHITYQNLLIEGEAIGRFFNVEIERLGASKLTSVHLAGDPIDPLQALRHGQATLQINEHSFLAVQGLAINTHPMFASELGHILAEKSASFGLIWQVDASGEVKASLRADGRVDVAAMASRYGGGGHPNAAGFRMPLQRFMHEVLRIG